MHPDDPVPEPPPERDDVPRGLVRTSAIAVAIAIAASIGAVLLLGGPARLGALARPEPPPPPARLDTVPFLLAAEAEQLHAAAAVRLRSYGWVDRAAGTVHVPLEVAIELIVAETSR